MKARTAEYLKIGVNEFLPSGTLFEGPIESFPHYIQDMIESNSKAILILEQDPVEEVLAPAEGDKTSSESKAGGKGDVAGKRTPRTRKKLNIPTSGE